MTVREVLRRLCSRRVVIPALTVGLLVIVAVVGANLWIRVDAAGHEYSAGQVPAAPVAVVFGAQVDKDGEPSVYLAHRLDLGARLLAGGKVQALLLTGDFGQPEYDEPDAMKRYLVAHGAPANKIALDYAGFNTYSSCARAYRIFGVRRAIVVTTDFSVSRTVALCRSVGLDVDAVSDHNLLHNSLYARNWLRDQLADTKAVFSIVAQPDPKYLGRQEHSVTDAIAAH